MLKRVRVQRNHNTKTLCFHVPTYSQMNVKRCESEFVNYRFFFFFCFPPAKILSKRDVPQTHYCYGSECDTGQLIRRTRIFAGSELEEFKNTVLAQQSKRFRWNGIVFTVRSKFHEKNVIREWAVGTSLVPRVGDGILQVHATV